MKLECSWLPKRILPLDNADVIEKYKKYEDDLYDIFLTQVYNKINAYHGKIVSMKKYPTVSERPESFYHIISGSKGELDIERASRILWGKALIEHEPCKFDYSVCGCSGLLVWDFNYNGRSRRKILFKEKHYIVILENRPDYWLYITSYYIENSYKLRALEKEHHEATKNALHT